MTGSRGPGLGRDPRPGRLPPRPEGHQVLAGLEVLNPGRSTSGSGGPGRASGSAAWRRWRRPIGRGERRQVRPTPPGESVIDRVRQIHKGVRRPQLRECARATATTPPPPSEQLHRHRQPVSAVGLRGTNQPQGHCRPRTGHLHWPHDPYAMRWVGRGDDPDVVPVSPRALSAGFLLAAAMLLPRAIC